MEFSRVVQERCSIRHYDDRRVDDTLVAEAIEQASWAPSAGNAQPWQVVVLTDDALRGFLARFESDALDLVLPGAKLALIEAAARNGRQVDPSSLDRVVTEAVLMHELSVAPPSHLLIVYQENFGWSATLRALRLSVSLTWLRLRQKLGLRSRTRYLWLVLSRWRRHISVSRRVRLASACHFVYALTLCACNRGVDSCIIGAFNLNGRAVHRFVGLRARHEIVAVVALGYRRSDGKEADAERTRWSVDTRWLGRAGPAEAPQSETPRSMTKAALP